jgi:hypothetical protein
MPTKLRNNLWIGEWQSAANLDWLQANNVSAILNVAADLDDPRIGHGVYSVKVGLVDGPGNPKWMVDLAVKTLILMLEKEPVTYAHCISGQSRSVHVVCRALAEIEGTSYKQVHAEIRGKRDIISNSRLDGTY